MLYERIASPPRAVTSFNFWLYAHLISSLDPWKENFNEKKVLNKKKNGGLQKFYLNYFELEVNTKIIFFSWWQSFTHHQKTRTDPDWSHLQKLWISSGSHLRWRSQSHGQKVLHQFVFPGIWSRNWSGRFNQKRRLRHDSSSRHPGGLRVRRDL